MQEKIFNLFFRLSKEIYNRSMCVVDAHNSINSYLIFTLLAHRNDVDFFQCYRQKMVVFPSVCIFDILTLLGVIILLTVSDFREMSILFQLNIFH